MEDESRLTVIEQYFNELIAMHLATQIIVSDRQGNTVLSCLGCGGASEGPTPPVASPELNLFTSTAAIPGTTEGQEDLLVESNVALSGARCYQSLEQLMAGGESAPLPLYVSAQYHDAVVVHTMDHTSLLTIVGSRARGHYVGGLLALLPQIRRLEAYKELTSKVESSMAIH